MTPAEKLRFVLNRGKLIRSGDEWIWTAAPDKECIIRTMCSPSRWDLVEFLYDKIREYNAGLYKKVS